MASRYGLEIRAADSTDAPGVAELLQVAGLPAAAVAGRLERLKAERATVLLAIEWGPPSGLIVFHARQTLLATCPAPSSARSLSDPTHAAAGSEGCC
ncbi:hypothetical protein [Phenylobacterium sp.]|uniref:hypothetical protein n=1 Tax=Phenylobacterium sp. TaxID=1871053 RepID=UPI00286DD561|nr:hypothetical protein [Phenylobacterium sp.]